MAAYYLFTKTKNLKFIPISFFVIVLLSIYGPQSAFTLSGNSQLKRLETLLVQNNMLVNDKIVKVDGGKLTSEDSNEISSIVWYLVEYRGVSSLQPLFNEDLKEFESEDFYVEAPGVLNLMGVGGNYGPYDYAINVNDGSYKAFFMKSDCPQTATAMCATDMGGYKYFVSLGVNGDDGGLPTHFLIGDREYLVGVSDDQLLSLTTLAGDMIFSVNLKDFVKYLEEAFPLQQEIPAATMILSFKGGMVRILQVDFYNDDLSVVILEIMMN